MTQRHESAAGHPGRTATGHPTPATYAKVAVTLAVITIVEVLLLFVDGVGGALLVTALVLLAAWKFALVALFYMHLKFDSRLFAGLFSGGLAIAISIVLALLALFLV